MISDVTPFEFELDNARFRVWRSGRFEKRIGGSWEMISHEDGAIAMRTYFATESA